MRVIALFILLATGYVGWYGEHQKHLADVATLKADHSKEKADEAAASLARIQAAQARGDALETRLAASESARQTAKKETSREIDRLTTGRPCLGSDAVRLLNRSIDGAAELSNIVPETNSGVTTADGLAATDTDVGQWIATASDYAATCRERLDALIDWHIPTPQKDQR